MLVVVIIIAALILSIILASITIIKMNKWDEDKVSFRESMDLTGFPVITFYIGDKKLNFLLDTGSNVSYINKESVSEIPHVLTNKCTTVTGLGDVQEESRFCEIEFFYKEKQFKDEFCIVDLTPSFNTIKSETGVTLHGLLGSRFFRTYKYVLNFDELIAYSKKHV